MADPENQAGRALEQLLDRMHAAVLAGDIRDLATAAPELEAVLADFATLGDRGLGERLRRKAARNATCLQAAARGLRAARRRIAEIRSARDGLQTYDGHGKRTDMPQGTGRLAQRF